MLNKLRCLKDQKQSGQAYYQSNKDSYFPSSTSQPQGGFKKGVGQMQSHYESRTLTVHLHIICLTKLNKYCTCKSYNPKGSMYNLKILARWVLEELHI